MTSSVCSFILPECLCSAGAKNGNCDQDTGKCFCQEGATGDKCDTCLPYYSNTPTGCEKCSACVLELANWNTNLDLTIDDIDVLYLDAYAKQQADTLDLREIKHDVYLLNVTIMKLIEDNVTINVVNSFNSTYISSFINLQSLKEWVS